MAERRPFETVRLDDEGDALVILDQTQLPEKTVYLKLTGQAEIRDAIYQLKVRGAPAIGVAAAYGAYLGVKRSTAGSTADLARMLAEVAAHLASARPTAVNLSWALERMKRTLSAVREGTPAQAIRVLKDEADAIRDEDRRVCLGIGEHALSLLEKGWGLLTHCNAGALATAGIGTATAPIYLGWERGYAFKVFADETRPLLQGARLTAWELSQAGIDVTLICDNMASLVMKEGKVQAVLVGCDRVAANGDAANKIGTSGVAVLARYYGIPFYIHAPVSSIDLACRTGADIPIECRPAEEVTEKWYSVRMGPRGVKVFNPAFDVTDHELITAIITENGIARPPYRESLARCAGVGGP